MKKITEDCLYNLINSSIGYCPIGLFYGEMGIVVYLLNRSCNNDILVEKLLEDIYDRVKDVDILSIDCGLLGIGLGLNYICKTKGNDSDIDDVLEDIDNKVFKRVVYNNTVPIAELSEILIYLMVRFRDGLKDDIQRNIFKEVVKQIIERIYKIRESYFFSESIPYTIMYPTYLFLYALVEFHKLGIYSCRIERIVKEIKIPMLANFPYLYPNRLIMLFLAKCIAKEFDEQEWDLYAEMLNRTITIEDIINYQMKNKSIYLLDGVASVYIIANEINKLDSIKLNLDKRLCIKRIFSSIEWKYLARDKTLLRLNGYLGIRLLFDL